MPGRKGNQTSFSMTARRISAEELSDSSLARFSQDAVDVCLAEDNVESAVQCFGLGLGS